jgi:plastocyanin
MPMLVSSHALRRAAPVLLLLTAAACGGDSGGPNPGPNNNPPPPAVPTTDINIDPGASARTTTAFDPNPKSVSLGGNPTVTVRWINGDITGGDYTQGTATQHSILPDNAGDFTPSGNMGGNATHTITLSAAGDYDYHCGIHPNMVGTITVTP